MPNLGFSMESQHQNAESSGGDSEIVCDTFPSYFHGKWGFTFNMKIVCQQIILNHFVDDSKTLLLVILFSKEAQRNFCVIRALFKGSMEQRPGPQIKTTVPDNFALCLDIT